MSSKKVVLLGGPRHGEEHEAKALYIEFLSRMPESPVGMTILSGSYFDRYLCLPDEDIAVYLSTKLVGDVAYMDNDGIHWIPQEIVEV